MPLCWHKPCLRPGGSYANQNHAVSNVGNDKVTVGDVRHSFAQSNHFKRGYCLIWSIKANGSDCMRRLLTSSRLRLLVGVSLVLTPALAVLFLLAPATDEAVFHRALALLGAVALVMFTLIWLAAGYFILRPMRALRNAADRMAAGDLTARVPTGHFPKELAKLRDCFNAMADALEC